MVITVVVYILKLAYKKKNSDDAHPEKSTIQIKIIVSLSLRQFRRQPDGLKTASYDLES